MKKGIFISYSVLDKDKVELIKAELKLSSLLEAIIIPEEREPLNLLTDKVIKGISKADFILPIITSQSINTQWINQEIGFATALKKRIIPIVEVTLIDTLKGFIHKGVDLPYTYSKYSAKKIEQNAFIAQLRTLISDLETHISISIEAPIQKPSTLVERTAQLKLEEDKKRKIKLFLNSSEGAEKAHDEVEKLFLYIEENITILKPNGFHFGSEHHRHAQNPYYIIRSTGFSFRVTWTNKYSGTTEDSILYLEMYIGNLSKIHAYPPSEKAIRQVLEEYSFSISDDGSGLWINRNSKAQVKSADIVDAGFNWLIDMIQAKQQDY